MIKTVIHARDPLLRREGREGTMGLPGLLGGGGLGRDRGSHRAAGGLLGGVGKRPWVSQARWGDRVMVADTMVTSSRVAGLLQMPWIPY